MVAHTHALAAALLCALAGQLGTGASLHCAMRREISPCTCRREETSTGNILVVCQRVNTYEDIARALTSKFSPETKIGLEISYSQMPDFTDHSFRELGLSITKLKLNFDNLRQVETLVTEVINSMCSGVRTMLAEKAHNYLYGRCSMLGHYICRYKVKTPYYDRVASNVI